MSFTKSFSNPARRLVIMTSIPANMKVAEMLGIGRVRLADRPVPEPRPGEVLVKVERVGICGSDLHYFAHGRIGNYVVQPPFILGHEAGGIVVALGPGVESPRIGDLVALEPGVSCGRCQFCLSGRYHLCPDVLFFATPPVDGVLAEYVAHPANLCFPTPSGLDSLDAALIEPLAVGFHAAAQGRATIGQKAVVFGAGCIGLMTLLALKARGLTNVTIVDLMPSRLNKALELGAHNVVNSAQDDYLKAAKEITGGYGFDLAFETSGAEAAARLSIESVKKGATIVLVGYGQTGEMTLPVSLALDKEVAIQTVFRYHHVYPVAIEAVAAGLVSPRLVVTNSFDFADIQEALDRSLNDKASVVKSVVIVSG